MDLNDLKNNPDQIKSLIAILSSLLPDESNNEVENTPVKTKRSTKTKTPPRNKDIKTHKTKAKANGNNIFDSMIEKQSHKEDSIIDKKLNRYPPTERNRQFEYVTVQCRCCGKKEKVNPGLLTEKDRYKCNKCAISAG